MSVLPITDLPAQATCRTIQQILLSSPKPKQIPNIRFIRSCSSALSPSAFLSSIVSQSLLSFLSSYIPRIGKDVQCSSSYVEANQSLLSSLTSNAVESYAMTEAAHQMTSNPLPPAQRKPGTVGKGQGVEIRTLDDNGDDVPEGEVCIRGANVTKGYLNNPEANKTCVVTV